MTEQTVNIPLLRKAVEWAEVEAAKPIELSQWNQLDWVADAATQARARNRVERATNTDFLDLNTVTLAEKSPECGTCYCIAGYVTHEIEGHPVGSHHESWSMIAAAALGLNDSQEARLFNAGNTIGDVRRIAEEITGERL